MVRGTNELFEADGDGGPATKYAALFDPRPVFDGLRVSFLRMSCGERLVRLEDALGEYLESEPMPQAQRRCWSAWTDAELIMIHGELPSSLRGSQQLRGHVS